MMECGRAAETKAAETRAAGLSMGGGGFKTEKGKGEQEWYDTELNYR